MKRKASREVAKRNNKKKLDSSDCYIVSESETDESEEELEHIILRTINGEVDVLKVKKKGTSAVCFTLQILYCKPS